ASAVRTTRGARDRGHVLRADRHPVGLDAACHRQPDPVAAGAPRCDGRASLLRRLDQQPAPPEVVRRHRAHRGGRGPGRGFQRAGRAPRLRHGGRVSADPRARVPARAGRPRRRTRAGRARRRAPGRRRSADGGVDRGRAGGAPGRLAADARRAGHAVLRLLAPAAPLRPGDGAVLLAGTLYTGEQGRPVATRRSFFGVNRVTLDATRGLHLLIHGSTLHGVQSIAAGQRRVPLGYYARSGPVAALFGALGDRRTEHAVAVLGLGAGALACYAAPGEVWDFYEIDPLVERIA